MVARIVNWMAAGIILAGCAGCAIVGKVESTTKEIAESVYPADKKMGWYQTKREQPMYLMTARLMIPQANTEKVKEIPIQRFERITWSGQKKAAPEMIVSSSNGIAALPGQCNGTMIIDADKSKDNSVVLSMRYWWQTSDQVKGRLVEDVEVNVGQPAEVDFDSGAVLKVDWKKVGA